ncbi:hypothetical protein HWB79_gp120 [Streptomyces phage LukeCage]|uniref:Uncharacterized protein n=1 Tax=Streptomyces phage LukeCage TaxID=2283304 RepID=A0A345MGL0_9CAUD|nr:hypothetical protein HWB79_gp120 [Streptomyces phage LukeCage]AXH69691.1 hypothetical protein SEA_LUKECAGE_204 [Streptomyces phage LukeCage]
MAGNKNSRKKWLCLDCGVDTGRIGEHFFLINDVWSLTGLGHKGMLCVEHVEKRIGRRLVPADFASVWINGPRGGTKSQRLANRLGYK